jgi:SAM-dependent methyltransferase
MFDVVYTSVGVLWWLDDLTAWARLIAQILRPSGVFFIREVHPIASALDDQAQAGELRLDWPYFNVGPILDESDQDYSSPVPVANAATYGWAHSLGEIIGSLLSSGLTVLDYQEHRTLPWKLLPWMERENDDPSARFVLPESLRENCPLEFSLVARKATG